MEMSVAVSTPGWKTGVVNYQQEVAAANYPSIRIFTVKKAVTGQPQGGVEGQWVVTSPQTVGEFSAVGYFFGREVHKALGVPMGLIHTSWGGTPAESWTSAATLKSDPEFKPILDRREKSAADFPDRLRQFQEQFDAWKQSAAKAEAEGRPVPPLPKLPEDPRSSPWRPAGLYNAMLVPLIPYAIRGAIWYQGESNSDRAYQYRKLFPAMIRDWREAWGQGDFPFLFVQLANFVQTFFPKDCWAELREAQLLTLSLPKTGMAVAADIGDPYDIHPKNKQDVGRRLALAAQAIAYEKAVVYSGPIYEAMSVEASKVRLQFKYADGRLVAKGGKPLKGFEIAGEDRKFVPAQAKINAGTVVVFSDQVLRPVAVRYAWADNPDCSLYNKAGLPASPFRTDDWPGVTADKR
jgi:sialate O-acetylesterase